MPLAYPVVCRAFGAAALANLAAGPATPRSAGSAPALPPTDQFLVRPVLVQDMSDYARAFTALAGWALLMLVLGLLSVVALAVMAVVTGVAG